MADRRGGLSFAPIQDLASRSEQGHNGIVGFPPAGRGAHAFRRKPRKSQPFLPEFLHMLPTIITILVVAGVIGLLLIFVIVGIYNKLVKLQNRYENAFSQIDVQLKRRHDLIPNLVETAKGYMKHEEETLTAVVQARNLAVSAQQAAASKPGDPANMKQLGAAEAGLNGALSRLLMVAESYPDLKANQNMMALQEELTSTENKVAFARQGYNDAVTEYNTQREVFPAVVFAGMMGFDEAELLEIENPEERAAPKVTF